MSKKTLIRIIILLVLSASCLFTLQYISSLKENITSLTKHVTSLTKHISTLEHEKLKLLGELEKEKITVQQLNTKNVALRVYLKNAHNRLRKAFVDFNKNQEKVDKFDAQFSILKAENSALLEEREKLTKENEVMKMKLSSVKELKKAIRELANQLQLEGNRGFLLKDGQPTSATRVKIEVIPVSK